jgi:hypothetical protein
LFWVLLLLAVARIQHPRAMIMDFQEIKQKNVRKFLI